jgi:hypothetical protein
MVAVVIVPVKRVRAGRRRACRAANIVNYCILMQALLSDV